MATTDVIDSEAQIPEIGLELAFQIRIDFKERTFFRTPTGRRAFVPPTGGKIWGPRLQGRVMPYSGADWAANGRLNAHYMLEAADGTPIYINNQGYLYRTDGKSSLPGDPNFDPKMGPEVPHYFRCTPVFDCPVGPHDWLTRTVLVGIGQRYREPDHTIFTYYAVL